MKSLRLLFYLFVAWSVLAFVIGHFRPQWRRELDRAMRIAASVLLLGGIAALGWHFLG
ncbi:protein MIGRI [Chitiniphilus shinanonensis]|uniref:protein MIGRI n=1 Tax=Chitiniphilus shinanonensis TaxID=553088 RepID=UPI00305B2862